MIAHHRDGGLRAAMSRPRTSRAAVAQLIRTLRVTRASEAGNTLARPSSPWSPRPSRWCSSPPGRMP